MFDDAKNLLFVAPLYLKGTSKNIPAEPIEAVRHLKIEGMAPGGKPNPCQKAATDAAKVILQCPSKLGPAATDRLKLTVPKAKKKNPVDKWLAFLPESSRRRFIENE